MSVSYEQEIRIKNFIEHFKSKGKVYGNIHITIADNFHSIDHETFLDSDIEHAESMGFEDGQDDFEEKIAMMNGIDLSEFITEEQTLELYEYYKDKKE